MHDWFLGSRIPSYTKVVMSFALFWSFLQEYTILLSVLRATILTVVGIYDELNINKGYQLTL